MKQKRKCSQECGVGASYLKDQGNRAGGRQRTCKEVESNPMNAFEEREGANQTNKERTGRRCLDRSRPEVPTVQPVSLTSLCSRVMAPEFHHRACRAAPLNTKAEGKHRGQE